MESPQNDPAEAPTSQADAASPVPHAPLVRALDQSEQVKTKVEECAADLSAVNTVLKQEISEGVPVEVVEQALEKSEEVEAKVQECADDLATVNDALAEEIDERHLLEHRLTTVGAALDQSRVEERKARHQALHDPVTGLPNMTLFSDRLEAALVQAARHSWRLAVMFIDLDDFKAINDTHGHEAGDLVLRMVAQRLDRFVRGGDTVSRRSGDEFLLLMLEAKDADTVGIFARKIVDNVSATCEVHGVQLAVRPSIGIAVYPEDGATAAELLEHADTAMYCAKRLKQGFMQYSEVSQRRSGAKPRLQTPSTKH
jgi:diguanylate cyclase (GGDEF)-like protein